MRRRIKDEFTDLPLSRQRKYQLRMQQQRRCIICGKPAVTASHCLSHAIKARERIRAESKSQRRYFGARSYKFQLSAPLVKAAGHRFHPKTKAILPWPMLISRP